MLSALHVWLHLILTRALETGTITSTLQMRMLMGEGKVGPSQLISEMISESLTQRLRLHNLIFFSQTKLPQAANPSILIESVYDDIWR